MSAKEKLLEFIHQSGEVLGFDELEDPALEVEVERVENADNPFYCTDVLREETNEVYRFCLMDATLTLEVMIPFWFAQYRELEAACVDEYDGAVLFVRKEGEDAAFWYLYRTETGEVALFHSELSLEEGEDDDEEEDEDDDTHLQNGKE
jgi:hypothetical protein